MFKTASKQRTCINKTKTSVIWVFKNQKDAIITHEVLSKPSLIRQISWKTNVMLVCFYCNNYHYKMGVEFHWLKFFRWNDFPQYIFIFLVKDLVKLLTNLWYLYSSDVNMLLLNCVQWNLRRNSYCKDT